MKLLTHDEKGYPLNYNPSTFYQEDESFFHLPTRVLDVESYSSYMISNWGRLYNIQTGNYLPQTLIPEMNDYVRVLMKLASGTEVYVPVHRIVALTFYPIDNPQDYVVNHKDGVKWHNEPYNLEWVTNIENIQHAINTGLSIREGENNPWAALTNEQYHMICKLTQEGYFPAQINQIMNLPIDITNIAQKIRQGSSGNLIASEFKPVFTIISAVSMYELTIRSLIEFSIFLSFLENLL